MSLARACASLTIETSSEILGAVTNRNRDQPASLSNTARPVDLSDGSIPTKYVRPTSEERQADRATPRAQLDQPDELAPLGLRNPTRHTNPAGPAQPAELYWVQTPEH